MEWILQRNFPLSASRNMPSTFANRDTKDGRADTLASIGVLFQPGKKSVGNCWADALKI
jgi:hypothetical protein